MCILQQLVSGRGGGFLTFLSLEFDPIILVPARLPPAINRDWTTECADLGSLNNIFIEVFLVFTF